MAALQVKWMKCFYYNDEVVNPEMPWIFATDKQSAAIQAFVQSMRAPGALVGEKIYLTTGKYGSLKKYECTQVRLHPNCSISQVVFKATDARWKLLLKPAVIQHFLVVLAEDQNLLLLRSVDTAGNLYDHSFSIDTVKEMSWQAIAANVGQLEQHADAITISWGNDGHVNPLAKVKGILALEPKAKAVAKAKAVGKAKCKPAPKPKAKAVIKKPSGSSRHR